MTRRRIIATVSILVLVLSGTSAGVAAASQQAKIMPGVTVAGIALDGLATGETIRQIQIASRIAETHRMNLRVKDRSWIRTPRELGIGVDIDSTVQKAMRAGRETPFAWILHTLGIKRRELALVARIDDERFRNALALLSETVRVQASNGEVTFDGATVVVKPPTEGVSLSPAQSAKLLKAKALDSRASELTLPVTTTPPTVSEEETERVKEQAAALLERPTPMNFEGRELQLPPPALAAAMRVQLADGGDRYFLEIDSDALRGQIENVAPFTHANPKDARYVIEGDKPRIVPGEPGRTIDTELAARQILENPGSSSPIGLQSVEVAPEFTTDEAKALGIAQKIATYSTSFDPRNAPRVVNIDLMAKAIDDTLLFPGDTFSLNQTTGPRTTENGYQEAQVIVDGELVPGIGGGVCQVATTIFNAVFTAGLEILERTNHSLYISKYPVGRDATVNFGLQDLEFRNDTPYGILIKTYSNSRGITISLFSTPLSRKIDTSTSERRNPKEPPTKYVDDPSLPAGQEVVEAEGIPGFDVTVTRTVLANGAVLHSDTLVSKYRPWKRIIRRGTGPAAAESPSPEASP